MTNLAKANSLNPSHQQFGGVTELVLTNDTPEQLSLIMPMIAFLSNYNKDRWITWISPHNISRQALEYYGVNTQYIRVIHCNEKLNILWVMREALAAGNSHTVISNLGRLSDKDLNQLEVAATKGKCQGLLLRVR